MEVIAFFALFAITNYAISGGKSKSSQAPAKSPASGIFSDLGRKAVSKMRTAGAKASSDDEACKVPSELTESRNWDDYVTPSYRRR